MFLTVQANEYHKHPTLLKQMFKLRKKVFADQLNWDVPVNGKFEKDRYDDLNVEVQT